MELKKGFYVIGKDVENSKTFIFGIESKRFDTLLEDENEKDKIEDENFPYVNVETQILEVEWKCGNVLIAIENLKLNMN